ncbi:uncharacterized protein N7459_000135 [Penicillium hispanicum]|uniref:uncharacterized protein n=1 Tax=Penicillium hispanicum TaxID=1080232 RepID=UPI00253FD89E|nr:uncharacterized protein N7459_000135 [Penicillium hispanicum]KAJ5593927.1 hypothetical protein N7459_000135 [Penicillium hispanicum]
MRWTKTLLWLCTASAAASQATNGIYNLLKRRIPEHVDSFSFTLDPSFTSGEGYDHFIVQNASNGTIHVHGSSLSALLTGVHRYLTDVAQVGIWWFIGSRLDQVPAELPAVPAPINSSSTVRWRYHFNTVTFSYTSAFWDWEDWELQLDWLALRGVNLPLAWVGQEKILIDVFHEIGLTDAEIATFLTGPAFQAWNHLGNIQGTWGGDLPQTWIDQQFDLQKKIIARMVELGMTPVLPAFTGFVPENITRVMPNASVVRGSSWGNFPIRYTNDSFLEPFDDHFAQLQASFIHKQQVAYGNVTNIYTLDQYNENDPYSGDPDYLRNITHTTWKSLKQADPNAIWMMQGWLFYASSAFWTDERIEAFFSGVEVDSDMLILDLFSESMPQWRRTNSYYGKPWLWCQLHDFGGEMGFYGQIMNITQNASDARIESPSLVGYGLTPEGQEGNELMYDLLLDQAWSPTPISTAHYVRDWVASRYTVPSTIPDGLYDAWDLLRTTVYNNTNSVTTAVVKSIFELRPDITGLANATGFMSTKLMYNPSVMVQAWQLMYNASSSAPGLWSDPAYRHDMVDVTRQVMANAFITIYTDLITAYNQPGSGTGSIRKQGNTITQFLMDLDSVLLTSKSFRLSTWIDAARTWGQGDKSTAFLEYEARNQITLWGPSGQITDYASKQWAGLVSSYYVPRWRLFVEYLNSTPVTSYNSTELQAKILDFELQWQTQTWSQPEPSGEAIDLKKVLERVQSQWPDVFGIL